jgi:glycosyltransferase involved in cell wall biosynthesis
MAADPLVSVIIPAYNRARFVGEAVESALAQTFADREILVVDDGSTDGTREALARYGDRIRCVAKPNGGPASARNRGADEARGSLLAFLDSDDLWHPQKLALQVDYLRAHRDIAMVFTDVEWQQRDGGVRRSHFRRYRPHDGFVLRETIAHPCIVSQSVMIRRDAFQAVRFDEALLTGEGLDFIIRLALHFPIGLIDRTLVTIRKHDANLDLEWDRACARDVDVKYQAFFVDFERICGKCPQLRNGQGALVRRALAEVYLDWATDLLAAGRTREARARLRDSWRQAPRPDAVLRYLKSWVPR